MDAGEPGLSLLQGFEGVLFRQVTQEAHDEAIGDAIFIFCRIKGFQDALDRDLEGNAALCMALRIEEHLDMADIVGGDTLEISVRQVMEVRLGLQDGHALIVDVEKVLQVGELIGGADFLQRLEGDVDLVAGGELHELFRLKAAFQVEVKLCLGQGVDQGIKIRHTGAYSSLSSSSCLAGSYFANQPMMLSVLAMRRLGRLAI